MIWRKPSVWIRKNENKKIGLWDDIKKKNSIVYLSFIVYWFYRFILSKKNKWEIFY